MALDYLIQKNCAIHQRFSCEQFMHALKANGIAQQIWESTGGNVSSLGNFTWGTTNGRSRSYSFNELLGEINPINTYCDELDRRGAGCSSCDISQSRSGGRYACFGFINYPISAVAEHWLCKLFEEAFIKTNSPIPRMIIYMNRSIGSAQAYHNKSMKDNPWYSNRINMPGRLYELRSEPIIKYNSESIVLAECYFLLLQLCPDNKQGDRDTRNIIVNLFKGFNSSLLHNPPDRSAAQFANYFQAIEIVNRFGYALFVD